MAANDGKKHSATMRRARTPTILQLEAVECGAAALAMVLAYYGRIEPLANLRRDCGVSRDGSKASNILKAARRYGMLAKGFSKEVADLREVSPPFIIFWNFDHFVVVEGFGKDEVFINDPASGHRSVSMEEFERSFTGIALVMEPGPDFKKGGRRPSVTTAIVARLSGAFAALAYCILVGFLLVIPGLALAGFNQVFLDSILLEGRTEWLRPLMLAMVVTILVQVSLRMFQLRYLRRLRIMLSIKLAGRFMWHLLQLPSMFYAQRFSGEIANRSRLNDRLAGVLSGKLTQTAIDVVMMVFYAAMMYYYDAVLTTAGIGVGVVNILVLRWMAKRRVESNMRVLQEHGKSQGTALAGLQSMETIKSTGLESQFFGKWSGYYAKTTNARQELDLSNQLLQTLPIFLTAVAATLVLIVGGYRIINGHLSIGMLVAFQSLLRSFLSPINSLVNLGALFQDLQGDLHRVDDVLAHPIESPSEIQELTDEDGGRMVRLKGYVELSGITFGYSPLEAPLLEDFNLSIRPGQRVALVGASGSGKSTLLKLISGELSAWKGEVRFDGVSRDRIATDIMVNSFSIVSQEVFLFGGTVRDNLTLWDDTVPDSQLHSACQDASIHEVVLELPGGYDSELLEGGANLSGGQAQRLEIARALVNNPSILVLDEATSALDAETERIIQDRLRMRGCSCITVSHRLSTIRDCDEIVVMAAGKIVERGTHESLWQADGEYAKLIRVEGSLVAGE